MSLSFFPPEASGKGPVTFIYSVHTECGTFHKDPSYAGYR